jgi:hypothetical protein
MAQIGADENAVENPPRPEIRSLHREVMVFEIQPMIAAQLGQLLMRPFLGSKR